MAAYKTRQRASCGYGRDTWRGERVPEGGAATACAVGAQRQGQRHDGPCAACRGWGRVALGSWGPFLSPGGMRCLIALPPRGAPTFRAGQWPTAVRDVVCGTRVVEGLWTALVLALGQKEGLWELRVYGPRSQVFSMSWPQRWRVPGSIRLLLRASLGTRHAERRQGQCTQERAAGSQQTEGAGRTT